MLNIADKVDGNTVESYHYNSEKNEIINIINGAGIVLSPDGGPDPDTQMLQKATALYASSLRIFNNISTNPYTLKVTSGSTLQGPIKYLNNMSVTFPIAANNSTDDVVTFQIDNLAAKPLVDINGDPIQKNNLINGDYVTVFYSNATDRWVMLPPREKIIYVVHQAAKNIYSGGYTSGDWAPRPLTDILTDETGAVSLASNALTMPAGTYDFLILMHAYGVDYTAIRIVTDPGGTPTPIYSRSMVYYSGADDHGYQASAQGRFVLTAESDIQLQMQSTTTKSIQGMGLRIIDTQGHLDIDGVNNVYLEWKFIKRI